MELLIKTFLEILISQVIYTVYQLLYVILYLHICICCYMVSLLELINGLNKILSVCVHTVTLQ